MAEMKQDDQNRILECLVKAHGAATGFRLFGFMMHIALNPDSKLRNAKLMSEDLKLIKQAGIAPDEMKPANIGTWTRFLFKVGFDVVMVLARLVPAGTRRESLQYVPKEQLEEARQIALDYGLGKFTDLPEEKKESDNQLPLPI